MHTVTGRIPMRVGKGKEVERLPIIDSRGLAEACTLNDFVANHRFLRIARLPRSYLVRYHTPRRLNVV